MASPDGSLQSEMESLCATARWCYSRGWVPATSGNFSIRALTSGGGQIAITPSGLDKGLVTPADLLQVDRDGRPVSGNGKPSAETCLHLVLYAARPEARAVLHVHSVWNTLISTFYPSTDHVPLANYEILKGLSNVASHEHIERIPLISNTQDYAWLTTQFADALRLYPHTHGVLLSRHGLYTWGQSVAEARRHLEALEFLFEVEGRRLAALAARPSGFAR